MSVMEAEPSIICSDTNQVHFRMKATAGTMIVLFVLGVPATFGGVLLWYRTSIQADQRLRVQGEGETFVTNPNFRIRQRYRKLYEVWKLLLTRLSAFGDFRQNEQT